MNKFQIISLILRAICVVYFLIISYWSIFHSNVWWQALGWWFTNIFVIVLIGHLSFIFWERR